MSISNFPADKSENEEAYRLWDIPSDTEKIEAVTEAKDAGITVQCFDDLAIQESFEFKKIRWFVLQLPVGKWFWEWSSDGRSWHKMSIDHSFWPRRAEFNYLLDGKSGDAKHWDRWTKVLTKSK